MSGTNVHLDSRMKELNFEGKGQKVEISFDSDTKFHTSV